MPSTAPSSRRTGRAGAAEMRLCIVGGALQGMEAVLLAGRAGYETLVIDRRADAPAGGMADAFLHCDVLSDTDTVRAAIADCDAVLPAFEEPDGLRLLDRIVPEAERPLLFDLAAYELSRSKIESNRMMAELDVPLPAPWPGCGFPMVVKPSSQSGSIGVSVVRDEAQRRRALEAVQRLGDEPVQQQFVSGRNVSIEVIGDGDSSQAYAVTEVVLDHDYDCKMVVCEPDTVSDEDRAVLEGIGTRIADAVGLRGLMDVEAVRTADGLRVLEFDARIPSQTPAAVEAATGVNLVEELVCAAEGRASGREPAAGCSVYEHYLARHGQLTACGEREFGAIAGPRIHERLFGADLVITDYRPGATVWRATVINSGPTPAEVLRKRKAFITGAMEGCGLCEYIDRSPEAV